MSIAKTVYEKVFKRTSTFSLVVIGGAFLFEAVTDELADKILNYVNRGKLWHHIKDNYAVKND